MTSLEEQGLLQKDRLFLFSGLAAVTVFAWVYMLHMAWAMPGNAPPVQAVLDELGFRVSCTYFHYVVDHDGGHDASDLHPHGSSCLRPSISNAEVAGSLSPDVVLRPGVI